MSSTTPPGVQVSLLRGLFGFVEDAARATVNQLFHHSISGVRPVQHSPLVTAGDRACLDVHLLQPSWGSPSIEMPLELVIDSHGDLVPLAPEQLRLVASTDVPSRRITDHSSSPALMRPIRGHRVDALLQGTTRHAAALIDALQAAPTHPIFTSLLGDAFAKGLSDTREQTTPWSKGDAARVLLRAERFSFERDQYDLPNAKATAHLWRCDGQVVARGIEWTENAPSQPRQHMVQMGRRTFVGEDAYSLCRCSMTTTNIVGELERRLVAAAEHLSRARYVEINDGLSGEPDGDPRFSMEWRHDHSIVGSGWVSPRQQSGQITLRGLRDVEEGTYTLYGSYAHRLWRARGPYTNANATSI